MYLNQKNTTILLVGNNCTENDTIQKIIENEMNIKTSIVKNVEETLYLLKNNSIHPNIIFSDNDNMDGYDLCKQIKKLYPYIPVIAITKYNNKNLDKIFESGAMDFIYKPFNNIEIKKRIENVLKIKNIDSEIQKVSFLDKLTGLINREPFIDLLEQKISLCKRNNEKFALLFMDIDNFKTVNDVYGHNMGDKLLKQLGIKLKKNLRCGDILGRFGGDEFILCANRINNIDEITTIANKIIDIFKEKILIDNIIINVGVSIGIAIYPNDATNVIDLMKNSDLAMYKSKSKRSNNFYIYNKKLEKKLMFEYALNQALEKNEFKIYYQVIVDNKEKGCFIESLLRWESTELGIISPNDFIYILERNKSIIEVGEWVFRESCLKLIDFNLKNKQKSKISINISQIQLEDEFFIERVEKIIRETKINPKYIILEITEDLQIKNFNKIYQVLENLRKLKIGHIALDDFGSGYSSFSNLIKFPIDIVKIDKFFIDKFDDKKYINIVRTLIELIKKNNLSVVSEGIETELQYNLLREMGCDYFQGFYFSKPNENIIHLKGKQKMDKIIKQNCWQYHYDKCNSDFSKCPCPAKNAKYLNEINDGENGGRCCWMIPGTLCCIDNKPLDKYNKCNKCEFYNIVLTEQSIEGKLELNSNIEKILEKNK